MKTVYEDIPREFFIDIPHQPYGEPEITLVYRQKVVEIIDEGTTLDRVISRLYTVQALSKQYPEIRIKVYKQFVLLVAVELVGSKE